MAMRRMSKITELTVHHSASPRSTTFNQIKRWHTDPDKKPEPFDDIGYNFVIDGNADLLIGRPLPIMGAHARPNDGKIGVCVTGHNLMPGEGWSFPQIVKLVELSRALNVVLPSMIIRGHNDSEGYTGRSVCPGIDLQFLRDLVRCA